MQPLGVLARGAHAWVAVAALFAAVTGGSVAHPSHAASAARREALPRVLRFVDRSRTVTLPKGRRVPRRVTTDLWYPPDAAGGGPWPLVVFGHGFASTPWVYRRLLHAWAARGYVVAAPVFPLGNANAPGGPDENDIVNQPADMSFVISRLLALSASASSSLYGLVDPTRIAVAGQSDGAMTAFAAAYERPWRDDRVRAAVILSGAELGRKEPLDRTAAPLLAVQGSGDRINPPVYTRQLFRAVARPKFLLLLHGAGHLPPYTDAGRQLALVERVTVAFLDRYLGDGSLHALARAVRDPRRATLTSRP